MSDVVTRRLLVSIAFLLLGLLQGCSASSLEVGATGRPVSALPAALTPSALPERSDEVFVVLAFSGGGMRSASFSYGLLEALRDTPVRIEGRDRRLLDEVDVVTAVSGGSYTAAYFGLFADRIFADYEAKFLKRDVEAALKELLVNPVALLSLAMPGVGRSDVAAKWIGDNVFENRTFAQMRWPRGPFIIVNASDINTGTTFSFIQQQFDFHCSSVAEFPVARAVMASAAVPGYFTPIAVENSTSDCPDRQAPWVRRALERQNVYSREYHVARALERYADPASMPVVRLLDGGLTDNLGVRGSMMSPVMHRGNVPDMTGAFDASALDRVSKVLVVVANAQVYEDYAWSRSGAEPGLLESLRASFDSAIGVLNSETIGLARQGFMAWAENVNKRPERKGKAPVDVSFVTLTLDSVPDRRERDHFNAIPMSLSLSPQHVDELRNLARRLLKGDAGFQRFVQSVSR